MGGVGEQVGGGDFAGQLGQMKGGGGPGEELDVDFAGGGSGAPVPCGDEFRVAFGVLLGGREGCLLYTSRCV